MSVESDIDQLHERIKNLELKISELESYLGVEWYDVPMRECYINQGGAINYDIWPKSYRKIGKSYLK